MAGEVQMLVVRATGVARDQIEPGELAAADVDGAAVGASGANKVTVAFAGRGSPGPTIPVDGEVAAVGL